MVIGICVASRLGGQVLHNVVIVFSLGELQEGMRGNSSCKVPVLIVSIQDHFPTWQACGMFPAWPTVGLGLL